MNKVNNLLLSNVFLIKELNQIRMVITKKDKEKWPYKTGDLLKEVQII